MKVSHTENDIQDVADVAANRDVLAWLAASPSCHGDLGHALIDVADKVCGEYVAYSPSFAEFKYVALVTKRRVFALGHDMTSACFCVGPELRDVAAETGGALAPEIGAAWIRLTLFRADYPEPDLRFWMLRAYAYAREVDERGTLPRVNAGRNL